VDLHSPVFWAVFGIILTALVVDYLNGFHNGANSIASVASTRVLTPGKAVIGAACFNFAAVFIFRKLQLLSAAAYSLGHGTNDAQKTMGQRITALRPIGGFCAESAAAVCLDLR
jgi:phosphate/sulfate permease